MQVYPINNNLPVRTIILPFFSLTAGLLLVSCGTTEPSEELNQQEHRQLVDNWHKERVEGLKERDGWMKLGGLFWLEEGRNTFGSGQGNDVRFPEHTIPEETGYFSVEGNIVMLHLDDDPGITHRDGRPVDPPVKLTNEDPIDLIYGRLMWRVLRVGDLIGIRLFDEESPYYKHFAGFERYPVDLKWRIQAEFIPHEDHSTINTMNILGQTIPDESPGKLVFEVDDETYSLDVLDRGDSYFIPFGDQTNLDETYGSGRYIYTDTPAEDGKVIIDFNKSYNPPCAYNAYTTCQLPPEQNRLSLRITAGEKDYDMPEAVRR